MTSTGRPHDRDTVSVLLVDDHPLFLEGMRAMIGRLDWAEVVGEAGDADQALRLALDVQPDVVVMDLQLPKESGIEATRAITSALPNTACSC